MDNEKCADLYDRAADLLMMYGRSREFGEDSQGQLCLLGACVMADGGDPFMWSEEASRRIDSLRPLLRYIAANGPWWRDGQRERMVDIAEGTGWLAPTVAWMFNDNVNDDDAVIDTLRMCAKELRA